MPHVIEPASSGRATCRGCGAKIAKGEIRFGERQPNAFGDGEMTLWFHLECAAYKRPEPLLATLDAYAAAGDTLAVLNLEVLRGAAELGIAHRRLPRVTGAERAPTGRARCRHCRETIGKDEWRIALVFFEEYRFQPSGFVHAGCARAYFGTTDLLDRVRHFAPGLTPAELDALATALG
jgi:Poly(ADP-ribose) polymerase and DNA-Ligase Zn-finger region